MPKKPKQKKDDLIPLKKEKPTLEKQSIKSIDGFNLAEFSLSPLTYQTRDLANKEISFEWEQNIGGDKYKKCHFTLTYGSIPPNADTEDYLLVLLHLAQLKGTTKRLETSFYEIMKTKGIDYKPGKQQINAIVRHLDALMDLKIDTNFIYDRETKKWNKGIKTRVISSFGYKTKEYSRTRLIHSKDSLTPQKSKEDIQELEYIIFDETFYKLFVEDSIEFDLATYFSLENPTPKRLYRFGNKYVNNLGTFGLDLVHFCITRLGMKRTYVEGFTYISKLSNKLKPHIKRVNETVEDLEISIIKDKNTPSGYKIIFDKSEQLQLPMNLNSFTKAEKKLYKTLVDNGIYPTPAKKLITKLRTHLGRKSVDYIPFVIKRFKAYLKRTTLNVAENKHGAILLKAFENSWYFPEFMEWHSKKRKKEEQEEIARYGNLFEQTIQNIPNKTPTSTSNKIGLFGQKFNIKSFKRDHKEIFDKIYASQEKTVQEAVEAQGIDFVTHQNRITVEQVVMKKVKFFCEQCFDEWKKGNKDYFPPLCINIDDK